MRHSPSSKAEVLELAEFCETAAPGDQEAILARVRPLLVEFLGQYGDTEWNERIEEALRLTRLGASESAVLALIPPHIDITAGTFGERSSFVAQVLIPGWGKSHSRKARSIAMAWLAAFLRAAVQNNAERRP